MFYVFPFIQTSASTLWCVHRLLHRDGCPPTAKRLQAIQAIGVIEAIRVIEAMKAISTTFGWLPSHFSKATFDGCCFTFLTFLKGHWRPLSMSTVSLSCFSRADGHFSLKGHASKILCTIHNILVSVEKCIGWIISNTAAPLWQRTMYWYEQEARVERIPNP